MASVHCTTQALKLRNSRTVGGRGRSLGCISSQVGENDELDFYIFITSENGRKNHFGTTLATFANCTLSNGAYWRSRDAGHVAEKRLRQATSESCLATFGCLK